MAPTLLPFNCEIDLYEMCNLRCGFCSHNTAYFTQQDPIYSYENFARDFGILKTRIHFDTLHLMGGEPLLNKDLVKYLKTVKESGICNFLNILTNGILLREVDEEVFRLADGMGVSIYPSTSQETQEKVRENVEHVKQKFPKLQLTVHVTPWFFKMNTVEKNLDPQLVQRIFEHCYRAQQNDFSLFNGRVYRCFMSRKIYNFLNRHRDLVKDDFEYLKPNTHDSMELKDDVDAEELVAFLNQKTPLESCKWCLGCSGKRHGHSQIKPGDVNHATLKDVDIEGGATFLKHYIHRRCELENTHHQEKLKAMVEAGDL